MRSCSNKLIETIAPWQLCLPSVQTAENRVESCCPLLKFCPSDSRVEFFGAKSVTGMVKATHFVRALSARLARVTGTAMIAYRLTHHSNICAPATRDTTLPWSRKLQTGARQRRCRTFRHSGSSRHGCAVRTGLCTQASTSEVAACSSEELVAALALERDTLRSHNLSASSSLSVYRLTALCASKQQLHVLTALSEVLALTVHTQAV